MQVIIENAALAKGDNEDIVLVDSEKVEKNTSDKITLGIFIGVSEYESGEYGPLPSCEHDMKCMHTVTSEIKKLTKTITLQNEKSNVVKDKIVSFIEEYRNADVDEVFFYFSGHGERIDDDYYCVLNDFHTKKKHSTGLSETYLDGLVREIKPRVFTKIIDACFSGSKYIKDSFESKKLFIEKQASKSGLDNIYYFFSSRGNQVSYASKNGLSDFTDELLSCVLSSERDVRYIDLSRELADAFYSDSETQQPIFIMQGSYMDGFGKVTIEQSEQLINKIGVHPENETSPDKTEGKPNIKSLQDKLKDIVNISEEVCFDSTLINTVTSDFYSKVESSLQQNIKPAFDISIIKRKTHEIPNSGEIGNWLRTKKGLFAIPKYDKRTVVKQVYSKPDKIMVPKDNDSGLTRQRSGTLPSSLMAMLIGTGTGTGRSQMEERVLKSVKQDEEYISGFEFTCESSNNVFEISLEPKAKILPKISLWVVFIYSDREFFVHYSIETLRLKSWDKFEYPECKEWSVYKVEDFKKTKGSIISKTCVSKITDTLEKVINQEFQS